MASKNEQARQLLKEALDSYKEEYQELSEIWRNLDAKSQGVIAVDGIFLAGMFAFMQNLSTDATCSQKFMLTTSAILLTLSVLLALGALWIRKVPRAPVGEELNILIDDLLALSGNIENQRLTRFVQDHARMWREINTEVQDANETKAEFLQFSQGILVLSIIVAVVLFLIKVWS